MRADVVPVEDVLAEKAVPPCGRGRESLPGEVLRGGIGVGVERGLAVPRIARPPADLDLLRVAGVARYEIIRWRVSRPPGEHAHREIEGAPPRVDRRRPAAVGGAERGQNQGRLGRGREDVSYLAGVLPR